MPRLADKTPEQDDGTVEIFSRLVKENQPF